ncbi:hypothetical protein SDC9_195978 [bioreactor metagenome]|uniref:Uncharacterized protein n=1 Tax=bioreactor metagenome TaxID=1076179 RepID=A0A645IAK2_9ZZZZ
MQKKGAEQSGVLGIGAIAGEYDALALQKGAVTGCEGKLLVLFQGSDILTDERFKLLGRHGVDVFK